MIYQFLRVALCAALLTGTSVHAVGKRALWNFVEAKKELQKKLSDLRKMDATAAEDQSEALAADIQGLIDEVKKLDPTKASEFQEVLDASFEVEAGSLSLLAQKQHEQLKKEITDASSKIQKNGDKIGEAVEKQSDIILSDDGDIVSNPSGGIPGLSDAASNGYLDYLTYVTVPISAITFPFTKLIAKSYKMGMRLLDFITAGKIERIHKTYIGILEQEKDALAAAIANSSTAAALKINGFLARITDESSEVADVTTTLLPQEKRWFLGKIYDKAKTVASSLRTKETLSGSKLHAIVIGELLEYNAVMTPLIDLEKHSGLKLALSNMQGYFAEFLQKMKDKKSFSDDEKNLIGALYELHHTLDSANEESKKILDTEKKAVYPNGKLSDIFTFGQNKVDFEKIIATAAIDKSKHIDTRSYPQKVQQALSVKKLRAYKDDFAALAGLVLTIAGGSYLVESYLPQYKNKFTAYASAPITYVISLVKTYFKMPTVFGAVTDAAKNKAANALAAIKGKIKQLPYSDKIAGVISASWVKAASLAGAGTRLLGNLYAKVKGQSDIIQDQDREWEEQQKVYEEYYADDIAAQQAFAQAQAQEQRGIELDQFRLEQGEVERDTERAIGSRELDFDPFAVQKNSWDESQAQGD